MMHALTLINGVGENESLGKHLAQSAEKTTILC